MCESLAFTFLMSFRLSIYLVFAVVPDPCGFSNKMIIDV